ncbi:pantothenate kinase [Leptotrichia trevisanii]|uniref:pantothenate kinase n=1 Tax=Leptotrichia trevisanii TaxID=109328 RepID=UPI0026EC7713|nr:pantothenate kinase [Leptotrichia trevisanii]
MKKIFLLITILAMGVLSCANNSNENSAAASENNTQNVQNVEQPQQIENKKADGNENSSSEGEGTYAKGNDEEYTTNGKLHEEKFLNKIFSYTDTSESFKIQKDNKGYFLTRYVDESPEQDNSGSRREEIVRLKLERGTILQEVSNEPLAYAYDTKLKKMVFLNPENDYRIILATD